MLRWMMKMILDSSSGKLINEVMLGLLPIYVELVIEQIDGLSSHEILLVVEVDLVWSTSPKEFPFFLRLLIINTISMLVRTVIKHYVFDLAINIFAFGLCPIQVNRWLFFTLLNERPPLGVPHLTMLIVVKWLKILGHIIVSLFTAISWMRKRSWLSGDYRFVF